MVLFAAGMFGGIKISVSSQTLPSDLLPMRTDLPTVAAIMTRDVVSTDPDIGLDLTLAAMIEHELTCLPVINRAGRLVGMVSRTQARAALSAADGDSQRVRDVMTGYVYKIGSPDTLLRAARIMLEQQISTLPVVDDGQVVGIITTTDILRELIARLGADAVEAR